MNDKITQIYPLTSAQLGMLFYWLQNPKSTHYFEQFSLLLMGTPDVKKLEKCYQALIDQYDVFRTIFICNNISVPQQVVLPRRTGKIITVDYSAFDETEAKEKYDRFLERDRQNAFDLGKDILLRLSLVRLTEDTHALVWSFHHIILDGWSFGNIVQEFMRLYAGEANPATEQKVQFVNYVQWCEKRNKDVSIKRLCEYMDGFEQITPLAGARENQGDDTGDIRVYNSTLQKASYAGIQAFCNQRNTTVYTCLVSVVLRLLQIYNQTDDAVVGNVVSGRRAEIPGINDMAGMLINTLPLRGRMRKGATFGDLMHETARGINLLEEHALCPLGEVQTKVNLGAPLFDCIIAFENYPFEKEFIRIMNNFGNLPFKVLHTSFYEHTNYNMYLSIFPTEEGITFSARYNAAVYEEKDIADFIRHVDITLVELEQSGDIPLTDIRLVDEEEQVLLDAVNHTNLDYDKDMLVFRQLERSAEKWPDRVAVRCRQEQLTYSQLNNRANALANRLIHAGITKGEPVGVMMTRTVNLPAAFFAVMKAGGAYVPLQPTLPADRLEAMVKDSSMRFVLANTKAEGFDFAGLSVMQIEKDFYEEIQENPTSPADAASPVYILYTSGTTGLPKGVVIPNGALNNFVVAMENEIDFHAYKTILSSTNYTFDIFGLELYVSVNSGLTLVLADDDERMDPEQLGRLISENEIDVVQMTPSGIKMMLAEEEEDSVLKNVKCVLVGGETVSNRLLAQLKKNTNARIFNVYGPTETTIWSTISELTEKDQVDIGKPIANMQIYILGDQLERLPANVPGELYIAGDGLADGYLNRADLTEEMFVDNPFAEGKICRTGDTVRFNRDYTIDFIGRRDGQVKIRGYRIECEEVSSVLSSYQGIRGTAVVGQKDSRGTDVLVGYYVADETIKPALLRQSLAKKLPEYMIPSVFYRVDHIPLTASGKIDRKRLPKIKPDQHTSVYVSARNINEQTMVHIWERVLDREQVGIDDNFFEIGGHSLLATYLIAEIGKQFGIQLNVRDVFTYPTVRELTFQVENSDIVASFVIPKIETRTEYAVSPSQKRIYLMSIASQEEICWHMPFCIKVERVLDIDRLNQSCRALIQSHEILRTTFHSHGADISQHIHDDFHFRVEVRNTTDNQINDIIEAYVSQPFALDTLFLIRACVIVTETQTLLLLDAHHIIFDGLSLRNFISNLIALYQGESVTEDPVQYKDYVYYQKELADSVEYLQKKQFWKELLAPPFDTAYIQPDYRREAKRYYEGKSISFHFSDEEYKKITAFANSHDLTLFMFLSTALAVFMARLTGKEDVIIGTPVSGRIHGSLLESLGVFINTLPMRYSIGAHLTVSELLRHSRKMVMDCFENQVVSFEDILETAEYQIESGRNPLFDVTFIMQNTGVSDLNSNINGAKYELETRTVNSDLLFETEIINGKLNITLEYIQALYSPVTVEKLLEKYQLLILDLIHRPDDKIGDIYLGGDKTSVEQDISEDLSHSLGGDLLELFA